MLSDLRCETVAACYGWKEMLLDQIRQTRSTQLAYETEESSPYIKCIATPILNKQHNAIAGLSISTPVYRVEENMEQP